MKRIIDNNIYMLKIIATNCPIFLIMSICNAVLMSGYSVISILFYKYIIDAITISKEIQQFIPFLLGITFFEIVFSAFNNLYQYKLSDKYSLVIRKVMQQQLFEKSIQVDFSCFEDTEFFNKYTLAAEQSSGRAVTVMKTFVSFIRGFLSSGALITIISTLDIVVLGITIINVVVSFISQTKISKIMHQYYVAKTIPERKLSYANRIFYLRDYSADTRLFVDFPKIFHDMFGKAIIDIFELIDAFWKKLKRIVFFQTTISSVINNFMLFFLAYQAILKKITIGDFFALSSSSQQLSVRLKEWLGVFPQMYENSIYIENWREFMNYTPQISNSNLACAMPSNPKIELKKICFTYPHTDKQILTNINLSIASGERVAFVGLNGAGKTTLVKLLSRLYDSTSGEIMINGINIKEIDIASLRNNIATVTQNTFFYSVSIAENILMRPFCNIQKDETIVQEALEFVGLHKKINSLENGIYTIITKELSDVGTYFSGGELQKLIIARAFAKNSPILVLDEPSNSLDPIADNEINNSLNKLSRSKSLIVISHKLTNIIGVDRIYFLENGTILESGTHDELISLNGHYAEMFNVQKAAKEIEDCS